MGDEKGEAWSEYWQTFPRRTSLWLPRLRSSRYEADVEADDDSAGMFAGAHLLGCWLKSRLAAK